MGIDYRVFKFMIILNVIITFLYVDDLYYVTLNEGSIRFWKKVLFYFFTFKKKLFVNSTKY